MGHYSSFILRLWVETDGTWRSGHIQHVASRSKRRFRTLDEMLSFISQFSVNEEFTLPFSLDGADEPNGSDRREIGRTHDAPELDKA